MHNVAVIIPTHNDSRRLTLCLDAIAQQTYPIEQICVYVVDNNSTEDIKSVVEKYSFAKYLIETNPGAYCARNKALKSLGQEHFVAFTDADCIPDSKWIEAGVSRLAGRDCVLGGKVRVFSEVGQSPNLIERYEMLFAFPQAIYVDKDCFAVTANVFTTRKVVEQNGPFNESLYSGGDAEWGQRLGENGIELEYAPEVAVAHPARDRLDKILRKVKRTVGGCYSQRQSNPIMAESFSWRQLFHGFLPPVRALRVLLSHKAELSLIQVIGIGLLLFYFKYHTNSMKWGYKLGFIKSFERF